MTQAPVSLSEARQQQRSEAERAYANDLFEITAPMVERFLDQKNTHSLPANMLERLVHLESKKYLDESGGVLLEHIDRLRLSDSKTADDIAKVILFQLCDHYLDGPKLGDAERAVQEANEWYRAFVCDDGPYERGVKKLKDRRDQLDRATGGAHRELTRLHDLLQLRHQLEETLPGLRKEVDDVA